MITEYTNRYNVSQLSPKNNSKKVMWDVFIPRNSSLKLKTVVDNAIWLNYAVSSENISESIKIKTLSKGSVPNTGR